jgi:diguanylate cyclase (GGDEF)-like protein/PAS domain S-box-containing protein
MKHLHPRSHFYLAWTVSLGWLLSSARIWAAEGNMAGSDLVWPWQAVLFREASPLTLAALTSITAVILLFLLAVRHQQLWLKDQRLAESELRFRQFADNSNLVFWVRTREEVLYINQAYETIWGRSRQDLYDDPDAFERAVHPDDRERVRAAFLNEWKQPGSLDEEYRVVRPDASIRWVHARSFPVRDAAGRVIRWTGVAEDITERKSAEVRDRLLVSALQAAANAVIITDRVAHIEWVNPAFESLTGYRLEEALGRRPADLVKSGLQDRSFYEAMWRTILAGETWRGEVVNKKKDGSRYHEELIIAPVKDDSGAIRHFVGIKQDIDQRKHMEAELQVLATTDPLTGLPNRRHFLAQLVKELARLQRFESQQAALLMLDLDHFKLVNDRHGHATGDAALRHFAHMVDGFLRKVDLAGRMGGEEFAILLVGSDCRRAKEFAERLRELIARTPLDTDRGPLRISVSVGVTQLIAGDTADQALARADQALYRAKAQGRNRVEVCEADCPDMVLDALPA